MVIENISIPLPTEIDYLIGQNIINRKLFSYQLVLLVLTIGHLTGSLIAYSIGRWGDNFVHQKLKNNSKILKTQKKLIDWYNKYGEITVFLTRFIGYIRPWS
jgi:membrane protein DedA with SNARE-associated domain